MDVQRGEDGSARPARVMLGLIVLAAWSVAMVAVARRTVPLPADAVAGLLFAVPLCSLGEWLVHGILYHARIPGLEFARAIHHAGHHGALFPPHRYVHAGPRAFMCFRPYRPYRMAQTAREEAVAIGSQVALHFVVGVPLILLPAWSLTGSATFTCGAGAALAVISWLLAYVHGAIHTPRGRAIERWGWFRWLNQHHYIHHVDMKTNINFLLPICDVLFGTQKARLTPDEARRHPPYAQASARPDAAGSLAEAQLVS